LRLLAQHYSLDLANPAHHLLLALALAEEFVPGLQYEVVEPSKRCGRKQKWTPWRNTQLLADVDTLRAIRGCGDSEACQILATTKRYRNLYSEGSGSGEDGAKALNARLVEARKHPGCQPIGGNRPETEQERRERLAFLIRGWATNRDDAETALQKLAADSTPEGDK
jgi:hypothetical protein